VNNDIPNPTCRACSTADLPASGMQPGFCTECVQAMLHGRRSRFDGEPKTEPAAAPELRRAFIWFSRAWYGHPKNLKDGALDMVSFGDWHADGSSDGCAAVVWYEQGPRLECFFDGWFALAGMADLTSSIGNLNGKAIESAAFCELLIALGFTDRTPITAE
jgi:hypothetical protein